MKLEENLGAVLEPLRAVMPEPERPMRFNQVLDQTTGMSPRHAHV